MHYVHNPYVAMLHRTGQMRLLPSMASYRPSATMMPGMRTPSRYLRKVPTRLDYRELSRLYTSHPETARKVSYCHNAAISLIPSAARRECGGVRAVQLTGAWLSQNGYPALASAMAAIADHIS